MADNSQLSLLALLFELGSLKSRPHDLVSSCLSLGLCQQPGESVLSLTQLATMVATSRRDLIDPLTIQIVILTAWPEPALLLVSGPSRWLHAYLSPLQTGSQPIRRSGHFPQRTLKLVNLDRLLVQVLFCFS